MKLRIIAVGTRMPAWVEAGCAEYSKRLPTTHTPELQELAVAKRCTGKSLAQVIADEDQRMLAAIRPRAIPQCNSSPSYCIRRAQQ